MRVLVAGATSVPGLPLLRELGVRGHDVVGLTRQPAKTHQIEQAGAKPVTSLSTMLEWQRDWAHKETYAAVMDIVKNHYGAYGIGVEYAYTMVHGAPATKFPDFVIGTPAVAHR